MVRNDCEPRPDSDRLKFLPRGQICLTTSESRLTETLLCQDIAYDSNLK